jgi:hypothetical protein
MPQQEHRPMKLFITAAEAAYRLRALRQAALDGGAYAPTEFDRAILTHRSAERELARTLLRSQIPHVTDTDRVLKTAA